MSIFTELKRRNVLRVGAAYIVTAWLIIQVVETLFPVYGLSDAAIRMVVNILAIGFIPVLVLTWVFEWTPEGLKRDSDSDHDAPTTRAAAKRFDRIVLAVLALALGYFAYDKFVLEPERIAEKEIQQQIELEKAKEKGVAEGLQSRGEASIAVLPFVDLSPGGDQAYISDGIAEDILNLLQRMPELDVRSRTSAFRFKGADLSVKEIAKNLEVDHVLEGSVRRVGDQIRVTAQLIDARTDSHMWSDNFDRPALDVFAIMDEIALATTEQIGVEILSEPPRSGQVDADAYFLYLRANHLVNAINVRGSIRYFEEALAIEPDYVDALLGISRAYFDIARAQARNPDEKTEELFEKSDIAWHRAIDLQPNHPVILAYNGWQSMSEDDYHAAARLIESALEADAVHWDVVRPAIVLAIALRQYDLAIQLAQGAAQRDPYCAQCNHFLSLSFSFARQFAEAEAAMLRYKEKSPGHAGGVWTLGVAKMMQGKYDEALEQFERWGTNNPFNPWWGPLMIRTLQGEDIATELDKLEPTEASRIDLAQVAAVFGDTERAFRLLAQLDVKTDTGFSFTYKYVNSHFFDSLRGDPRWLEIEERAGLAQHQIDEINFSPIIRSAGSN